MPVMGVGRQLCLNRGPGLLIDQPVVSALIELSLMRDPSRIDRVGQQLVDMAAGKRLLALRESFHDAALCSEAKLFGYLLDPPHAAEFEIKFEQAANRVALLRIEDELAVAPIVAERR